MLFMLVDTRDSRYGGFDPDAQREQRWETISWRQFVPAAGSISCFAIAPVGRGSLISWALTAAGIALCAQFGRVSLREDPPRRDRPPSGVDDGE